jgi:hypothetical protein
MKWLRKGTCKGWATCRYDKIVFVKDPTIKAATSDGQVSIAEAQPERASSSGTKRQHDLDNPEGPDGLYDGDCEEEENWATEELDVQPEEELACSDERELEDNKFTTRKEKLKPTSRPILGASQTTAKSGKRSGRRS